MKRANGTGSIRYDKDRKRYEMRITVDGVRRKVVGRTQQEVSDRADELRRSLALGPGLPPEMTVGRFLDYWLTDVLPLTDVAPGTADNYRRVVRLYISPTIGRVRLDQLAPVHVRKMLTTLRDQGLSPNTQRLARSVLRRALRTAESDGYVTRNVAALVDGVKVGRPEGRTLTPDQARALLTSAEAAGYGALVTVLLSLGLRRGEALGLRWRDVELDATPATVRVVYALKKDSRGGLYLAEPKTAGSRRTVHLPRQVVDVLRAHRARQNEARLEYGPDWGGSWRSDELVFTTSIGTAMDPDRVNRIIKQVSTDAGIGSWTPHELRHSAASLLLAQNVPLKVVSEMLGHSSIRVTADVYGHLLEPARTEAADAMSAALWGAS